MILRSALPSPFGRMVKLAAHVLGLMGDITVEQTDAMDSSDSIRQQNPLGKIPALIDGDRVVYDSRVILEYLDWKAGGGVIIPASGDARVDCLVRNARNNGILDAAILIVYEGRLRPEDKYVETFVEHQRDKIRRALDQVAGESAEYASGARPDIAEIGLATVLDYLDLRKPLDWREHCPGHAGFMQEFADAVPGYRETLPPDIDPAPWRG